MPLHLIQLTDQEWMDWNAVVSCARLLSVNSRAGSYKGAIGNTAAGKALRADLTALVKASDAIVEVANSTPVADSQPAQPEPAPMPDTAPAPETETDTEADPEADGID